MRPWHELTDDEQEALASRVIVPQRVMSDDERERIEAIADECALTLARLSET